MKGEFLVKTLEETEKLAKEYLASLVGRAGNVKRGVVVGLSGHLGSGKTAFTKIIAKELGIQEHITSPTFVLMKKYSLKNFPWNNLVHIDAYRLEKRQDLNALDFENLQKENNLIFIEWPENVSLETAEQISFEVIDTKTNLRKVTIC